MISRCATGMVMLCSLNSRQMARFTSERTLFTPSCGSEIQKRKFELDAAVAEVHQARHGRRFAQHPRLAFAGLEQNPQGHFRIIAVAHANGQFEADARVGVAPIDHGIGNQLLIGHQHLNAVAVAHHDVAAAQFLHPAEVLGAGAALSRETDDIARFDGAIHQQHEAADEICRDRLQAETQSQADRAGEHRQSGQIHARPHSGP